MKKLVEVRDFKTNELIGVYPSMNKAAEELFVSKTLIRDYQKCKIKKRMFNVIFIKENKEVLKFNVYDLNNKVVLENKTAQEIAKTFNVDVKSLYVYVNKGFLLKSKYIIKRVEGEE